MKLRHAAALATLGFSLIAPPIQKDDQSHIDLIAPFGQSVFEQRYDTEEACFEGRDKMMALGSANFEKTQDSVVDRQRVSALCINSDDAVSEWQRSPRLSTTIFHCRKMRPPSATRVRARREPQSSSR